MSATHVMGRARSRLLHTGALRSNDSRAARVAATAGRPWQNVHSQSKHRICRTPQHTKRPNGLASLRPHRLLNPGPRGAAGMPPHDIEKYALARASSALRTLSTVRAVTC